MFQFTLYFILSVFATAQVCEDVYPHLTAGIKNTDYNSCINSGCCWDSDSSTCFMPKINGYQYFETYRDDVSFGGDLTLIDPSGAFGPDYNELKVDFVQETETRMHMVIKPANSNRWEIPSEVFSRSSSKSSSSKMTYKIINEPFQFAVLRHDFQELFFMSKMLIYQDQYIQFVLGTPKNVVATYGFGESSRRSAQVGVNESRSLWATDFATSNFDKSLYGSHPFYLQVLDDGTALGAFIANSNAMEVSTFHDEKQGNTIGVQLTGGIVDIYFFVGSSPKDVIKQYQSK